MRISDWSSDVCSSDLFGEAEDLGERPGGGVGFEPFDRARAEDQHAVTALAAEHFLPAEGRNVDLVPRQVISEHRAGRIGEEKAGRSEERRVGKACVSQSSYWGSRYH